MVADIVVRVLGVEQCREALRGLPMKLRRRGLLNALRAAARIVQREARRRTPVLKLTTYSGSAAYRAGRRNPGTVRDATAVRVSKEAGRRGAVGVFVNVRPLKRSAIAAFKGRTGLKAAANPDDPFYWRFINFGTRKKAGARALEAGARQLPLALREFERTLGPAVRKLQLQGSAA